MIKYEDIHEDVAAVLREMGVEEKHLFNRYSDLYIGCETVDQARTIRDAGVWRSLSSVFVPQKGSDMDKYKYAVDIGLAYMQHYHKNK